MRDASDPPRQSRAARLATITLLVNQLSALTCQFLQHTDPRFPLWYFTVDSAILAGIAAAIALVVPRAAWHPALRHTAAVGVVVSAVIFATVIAPATPTGTWFQPHDDVLVRTATVLFHGVAPLLVAACYLLQPSGIHGHTAIGWAFAWPLTYLAGLCLMVGLRGPGVIPYPFLAPGQTGWGTVSLAAVALTVLIAATGATLGALGRIGVDRPGQTGS